MAVTMFPFRYRHPLTGKWVKARYKATPEEIAERHDEWEIVGPAEIRSPAGGAFRPYRVLAHSQIKRLEESQPEINPHLERPPALDASECFLTALFLRRYVAYCARRRHYARMQGAARLHREVTDTMEALG